MVHQAASTQTIASYLTTGYWLDTDRLPHSFDTSSSNVISVNLTGLTSAGRALARAAIDSWESVANIVFRETTGSAKITFDDNQAGAFCSASWDSSGATHSAYINVGPDWLSSYGTSVGSYSFQTYVHEIGHALGLGHPGHYNGSASFETNAQFSNDCWQQTVMSYFSQSQNTAVDACYATVMTPMTTDIMAVQQLYGVAETGPTAGNTTYGLGSNLGTYLDRAFNAGSLSRSAMTISDAGGTDRIDFSNDTQAQQVNLGAGKFSNVYGLTGNLGVAYGTVIEHYFAGSGSDRVIGNAAANKLVLGAGNDTAVGGGGQDRLIGGAGNDMLKGGAGNDVVLGRSGADKLIGGAGNDTAVGGGGQDRLIGGAGNDMLKGGAGNDVVLGRSGADKLIGGAGSDDFVFVRPNDSAPGARDVITDFRKGYDDIVVSRIDANTGRSGDQAFALDWNGSFSAGEIQQKVTSSGLSLEFNTDTDAAVEMAILLRGLTSKLAGTDFIF